MKNIGKKITGIVLFATIATGFSSIATYSGVYNLNTGHPVLASITKGGHILTFAEGSTFSEEATPAKSTVNATGKMVASTVSGVTVVGQIASDFTVTGTVKSGGTTRRMTGKRFLN